MAPSILDILVLSFHGDDEHREFPASVRAAK
jgi:hypothetical protein